MAFIGVMLVYVIMFVLGIGTFLSIILFAIALERRLRKKKLAGLFLALGIVCVLPTIVCVTLYNVSKMISYVTLYDGSKVMVSSRKISKLYGLLNKDDVTTDDLETIEKLLSGSPNLIYWLDNNHRGVIDYGLRRGDYDLVEMALEYGAIFDDPRRYEHFTYDNSMYSYLSCINGRAITSEDIDILNCMFKNNASTEYTEKDYEYSNYFGMACWQILYNDETVTDTELKFISIFLDNGFYNDESFVLSEDIPSSHSFGDSYRFDVIKDDNYYEVVNLVTR